MSRYPALGCLPSVKKEEHDIHNKTIITFGYCDIQNNQSQGKGYQPQPSALVDNSCLDLYYSVLT